MLMVQCHRGEVAAMPTPQEGRRRRPTPGRAGRTERPCAIKADRGWQASLQEEAPRHPGGADETGHLDGDWVCFLADSGMLPSRSFLMLSLV